MRIIDLTLRNIACFENETIDFLHPDTKKPLLWNVFLGKNGTGKSTIVRSIALLLMSNAKDIASLIPRHDELVRYGREEGVISGTIELKSGERIEKRLYLPRDRHKMPFPEPELPELKNKFLIGFGSTRLPSFEPIHTLAAPTFHGSADARRVLGLFFDGIPHTNIDRWLDDEDRKSRRKSGRSNFKQALSLIEEVLNLKFDAFRYDPDMQALFKTEFGLVPLSGLAHGQKDILSILVDILKTISVTSRTRRAKRSEGVVLVEEIAKHLHPELQRRFMGTLKEHFPKLQFIATTHSPLIAQTLERYELLLLEKLDDGRDAFVRVNRSSITPKGLSIDQILTSEYFGLESAVNPDTTELRRRLVALKRRVMHNLSTKQDEKEYERLRKVFDSLDEGPGKSYQEYMMLKEITLRMQERGREDLLEFPPVQILKERRIKETRRDNR